MAVVENIKSLSDKLRRLQREAIEQTKKDVIVGYTAHYALYVHENIEMKLAGEPRPSGIGVYWGPNGQAKFLEEPARTMAPELRRTIRETYKRTKNMLTAMKAAGLRLQRESQKLVPVEYGNLKASAFTRVE